jgi:hypothetical protein
LTFFFAGDVRVQGRYDIYPDSMQEGVFASKEFRYPEGVRQVMEKELQSDFFEYAGALPSSGDNGNGQVWLILPTLIVHTFRRIVTPIFPCLNTTSRWVLNAVAPRHLQLVRKRHL